MTGSNTNPFAIPGFAQMGDASQNPMMASMEMMRHAWQSLAGAGAGSLAGGGMVAPPMSLEELDRRINELRTVENWLRMNLSMLSSTIQGMEVQRATIATIKSFVAPAESGHTDAPSALEVALGLKPSGQARIKPASEAPAVARASTPSAASAASSSSTFASPAAADSSAPSGSDASTSGAALPGVGSAEAWWGMLQQQFENLASVTAASLKQAESVVNAAGDAATTASKSAVSTASSVSSGLGKAVSAAVPGTAPQKAAAPKKATSSRATKKTAGTAATSRGTVPAKAGAPRAPRKRSTASKTSS